MKKLFRDEVRRFCHDEQGQDLIEYALMAGFVAVAAGALMPNVTSGISTIYSRIETMLADAGAAAE